MVSLSFYGYINGNIYNVIGGQDGDHHICGGDAAYR